VLLHAAAGATGRALLTLAKHRRALIIATASPNKHDAVRAAGADHVLDSRSPDLAVQVLELTGGRGADVVLESAGGATLEASLTATRRVTGRVVVYGLAGGRASLTNWDLVYRHPVQLIGLNIGAVIHRAPQLFGELLGKLGALIAAGVIAPKDPTGCPLSDGVTALRALEARETVGKWCLRP
jgi:NADPH:quinone reductase